MRQDNCPICSGTATRILFFCNDFPYFTVLVAKSEKISILQKYNKEQLTAPLVVKTCEECCHCYLAVLPNQTMLELLYSRYYSYPSPLKCNFPPERDNRFIAFFNEEVEPFCKEEKWDNILEVGCYDGYILYHLKKKGFSVTGCDPSVSLLRREVKNS